MSGIRTVIIRQLIKSYIIVNLNQSINILPPPTMLSNLQQNKKKGNQEVLSNQ